MACINRQQMGIQPLKMLDTLIVQSLNGKTVNNKFVNYKITGYTDNDESLKYITRFLEANKERDIEQYHSYIIRFFKASDETNLISLKQHPDRYYNLNTTIYLYQWLDGKFMAREKYVDGSMIEPKSNVVIKDQPVN